MWRLVRSPAKQPEPELKASAIARLVELEERFTKIEKKQNQLEFEWNEWYDKFRLMYARLSKRIREASAEAPEAPDAETPSQDAPGPTIERARVVGGPRIPRRNY